MRRDHLYLADIVSAADAIARFLATLTEAQFVNDDMVRSAVLQKLTIIGEAASRISPELRQQHAAIPWPDIIAFRNIAVHRYFGIDWQIVWNAATLEAPTLSEDVSRIIDAQAEGNTQ